MKSKNNVIKNIISAIPKIFWNLGLHAFTLILILILIDFILGGIIFYRYVFLVEKEPAVVDGYIIKFNEKDYQTVMDELQSRQQANQDFIILDSEQPKISNPVESSPAQ